MWDRLIPNVRTSGVPFVTFYLLLFYISYLHVSLWSVRTLDALVCCFLYLYIPLVARVSSSRRGILDTLDFLYLYVARDLVICLKENVSENSCSSGELVYKYTE